jgi:hypothetical protein
MWLFLDVLFLTSVVIEIIFIFQDSYFLGDGTAIFGMSICSRFI